MKPTYRLSEKQHVFLTTVFTARFYMKYNKSGELDTIIRNRMYDERGQILLNKLREEYIETYPKYKVR